MDIKKKVLIGLAAGTAVFAAVFGSAASLGGIDSDSLGADDAVVAACDTVGGITSTYTVSFSTGSYKVSGVTIGSVDAACNGLAMEVTLVDGTGGALATKSGTAATGTNALTLTTPVSAEAVSGIHVVISG